VYPPFDSSRCCRADQREAKPVAQAVNLSDKLASLKGVVCYILIRLTLPTVSKPETTKDDNDSYNSNIKRN
jgi:hypothetical protein